MKGTYLLILRLDAAVAGLRVGRLGTFTFAAGYYLYVGSAMGSGGLAARLAYHCRREKLHPHWHVDYLRAYARLVETWAVELDLPLERALVSCLAEIPGVTQPVPHFGSSDSDRHSHLLYTQGRPTSRALTTAVLAAVDSLGSRARHVALEIHTCDER